MYPWTTGFRDKYITRLSKTGIISCQYNDVDGIIETYWLTHSTDNYSVNELEVCECKSLTVMKVDTHIHGKTTQY